MAAFSIFVCSLLFLLYVARAKKIAPISLYSVFIAFQCLYNVVPWVTSLLDLPVLRLLSDRSVVDTQVTLAGLSNICFGLIFLFFYKNRPIKASTEASQQKRRNYFLLVLPAFLITCVLCAKYGWNQFATGAETGEPGGMYSVTAYVKHAFIAIYIYYLYRFGLDKWAWRLFLLNIIVLFIDGARTTFLPVAFLTLMLYSSKQAKSNRRVYIVAAMGVFFAIAARSIILSGNSSVAQKLIAPVAVEGTMGAYPSLQAIYAVQHNLTDGYTYGGSYVLDPLLLMIPSADLRDHQLLKTWERQIDPGIPDKFAPMGGFYYLAEAVAAFSYLGPPLVTTIFAGVVVMMERLKAKHALAYYFWVATVGVLFVKTNFANSFKIYITQFLLALMLVAIHRYRVWMAMPNDLRDSVSTSAVEA